MGIKQGNVTVDFEAIGTAEALKLLESNTRNRPVTDDVVRQYARDMKEGRWVKGGTTPIKFDTSGVLMDGQHRLWAVIESGATVNFLVARGVDPAERDVQDTGRKRTIRDILVIGGAAAGNLDVAIANRMMEGLNASFKPTVTEQLKYYKEHEEAIAWTLRTLACSQRGINQAGVLAPVARAWYTRDRGKLEHFLEVMRTGMMEGDADTGPILLRNWLLGMGKGKVKANRKVTYAKTERAIMALLAGEKLSVLKEVGEEQFPLPSEAKRVSRPVTKRAKLVKGVK